MRSLINGLVIVVAWISVAALVSLRLHLQQGDAGPGWPALFAAAVPSWLLWAAATPLIFFIARIFRPTRDRLPEAIAGQLIAAGLFTISYTFVFTLLDGLFSRSGLSPSVLVPRFSDHLAKHWPFILLVYAIVTIIAWLRAWFLEPGVKEDMDEFDNAILVTTRNGKVLVEIEKFQYVAGGGKRIMFHTGRTKELTRARVAREVGEKLVGQERYRPERRIVVDLGKIRKGEMTGPNEYIFRIGFSHQLKFGRDMYEKLGGWLPRPVLRTPPK
jgi:hypothetical protein